MTGGTIEEMAEKMLSCSCFVSNDSGVMNVANALGIPLVALFAPTNVTTRGPLGKNSVSIAVNKDCSPCEMHVSDKQSLFGSGECSCIGEITVKEVMDAIKNINITSGKK